MQPVGGLLVVVVALAALPRAAASISREAVQDLASSARRAGVRGRLPDAGSPLLVKSSGRNHSMLMHVSKHFAGRAGRTRGEELEEWIDSGHAVAGELGKDALAKRLEPISKDSYNAMLHEVTASPSRFIGTSGNAESAKLVKRHFSQLGFAVRDQSVDTLATVLARYPQGNGTLLSRNTAAPGNIVGFMEGTDLKHELVVYAAHYDSVNWEDTQGPAPGVDDNGSGLASVLMAAEALAAQRKVKPLRRSVAFVAFQAEEVGLLGSTAFVKGPVANGDYGKVVAALIADEVVYPGRPDVDRKAIFETVGKAPENLAIVDTLAHMASSEKGVAGFEVNYHGFGSDHIPFLDAGYPAVLLIERDNSYHADTWGHSARDTFEHADPDFGAAMTRLATSVILTLASPKS